MNAGLYRKLVLLANANPEGHNQYTNHTHGQLREAYAKADKELSSASDDAWKKPEHAGKGLGQMIHDEGEGSRLGKAAHAHRAIRYEFERRGLRLRG